MKTNNEIFNLPKKKKKNSQNGIQVAPQCKKSLSSLALEREHTINF